MNFLSACGFVPLHSNKNLKGLNIEIISLSGDKEVNSNFKNFLKKTNNTETEIFKIKIASDYKKIDFSKNTTGTVSLYKLILSSTINIEYNDKKHKIIFDESYNMENMTNNYDENKYERLIKQNFAKSVVSKLNIELLKLRW